MLSIRYFRLLEKLWFFHQWSSTRSFWSQWPSFWMTFTTTATTNTNTANPSSSSWTKSNSSTCSERTPTYSPSSDGSIARSSTAVRTSVIWATSQTTQPAGLCRSRCTSLTHSKTSTKSMCCFWQSLSVL